MTPRKAIYIEGVCHKCGKPLKRRLKKNKPQKYLLCLQCKNSKENPNLSGGGLDQDGYIKLIVDGKRIFQHRAVLEKYLGRKLEQNEIVHHLNGIRTDNRIDNLVVLNSNEHPRKSYIHILQERIRQLEQEIETAKMI